MSPSPFRKNLTLTLLATSLSCTSAVDLTDSKTPKKAPLADRPQNQPASENATTKETQKPADSPVQIGGVFLNTHFSCQVDMELQTSSEHLVTGCRFSDKETGKKIENQKVYAEAKIQPLGKFNKNKNAVVSETADHSPYNWLIEMSKKDTFDTAIKAFSTKDPRIARFAKIIVKHLEKPETRENSLSLGIDLDGANTYDFIFGSQEYFTPAGCQESSPEQKDVNSASNIKVPFQIKEDTLLAIDLADICGVSGARPFAKIFQISDKNRQKIKSTSFGSGKEHRIEGFKAQKAFSYELVIKPSTETGQKFRVGHITFKFGTENSVLLGEPILGPPAPVAAATDAGTNNETKNKDDDDDDDDDQEEDEQEEGDQEENDD